MKSDSSLRFGLMTLIRIAIVLSFLLTPSLTWAYRILFYYNSEDGSEGGTLRCASFLRNAGHRVHILNVQGQNLDPGLDPWNSYDQVWDMRYVDREETKCGTGALREADYFDNHWRAKAIEYLNHGGRLFLGAEHYTLVDRDEGLYQFLEDVHAVKAGYDPCPPSQRGNNTTDHEAFYRVKQGLGPVSFFGAYVGGIPIPLLTGINFVDTDEDWEGDGVDRSIASGWEGPQLGGQVKAPLCARGKLFMVWDATMWTLWQPEFQGLVERPNPIWDDSNWFSWDPDPASSKGVDVKRAQVTTRRFFEAIARWLGGGPCLCPTPMETTPPSAPLKPLITPLPESRIYAVVKPIPQVPPKTGEISEETTQTVTFDELPVNVWIHFKDGVGEYRLMVTDSKGNLVKIVYDQNITTQSETWTSWDGTNQQGLLMGAGTYYAVLVKDGKMLRRIILNWIVRP
jgi:hypothetical protein